MAIMLSSAPAVPPVPVPSTLTTPCHPASHVGSFKYYSWAAAASALCTVRNKKRHHSVAGRAEGVSKKSKGLKGPKWLQRLRAKMPKPPSKEEMKKYGTAMAFSYSFVGTLNLCMMVAISWPLFIMRTGGSPVLFTPLKMNPKYLLYLSGVYFTYGSITTPFLLAAALALAPGFTGVLSTFQKRLKCPKWLAFLLLSLLMTIAYTLALPLLIALSCLAFHQPVWK